MIYRTTATLPFFRRPPPLILLPTLMLAACVSNPAQVGLDSNNTAQLATSLAQAALAAKQGTPISLSNAQTNATLASNLPAKLSCKDIGTRLVKTRAKLASQGGKGTTPPTNANKVNTVASAATLIGGMTGNSQLADIGGQLGALAENQSDPKIALLNAQHSELRARANAQNCKLPIEARVAPAALKLNCKQIATEWLTARQAGSGEPFGGLFGGTDKSQKLAQAGTVVALAAGLTGNSDMSNLSRMGNGAPAPSSPSGLSLSLDDLEALATTKRCKLPNAVANASNNGAPATSCTQIKKELTTLNQPAGTAENPLSDKVQAVGMVVALAGAMTGDRSLANLGTLNTQGADPANAAARKVALITQAKSMRCKL